MNDLKGLPVKDEKDLAEGVIGTTKASLQMQAANVRYILGYEGGTLTDFSKMQGDVVDEYKNMSVDRLKEIVINIIISRDLEENINKVREANRLRENKKKKKKSQDALDEIFRKMGKDPSKMRKIIK